MDDCAILADAGLWANIWSVDVTDKTSTDAGSAAAQPISVPDQGREMQLPRIECVIEHDLYIAGQRNVVRLLLTNPYDKPIEILGVETPQTSSFEEYLQPPPPKDERIDQKFWRGISSVFSGVSLGIMGISVEVPQSSKKMKIYAEKGSEIIFDRSFNDFDDVNIYAENGGNIVIKPDVDNNLTRTKKTAALRPRSTIVVPVSVKTSQWLLFTPQRFGLNVELTFSLDGVLRTQVINAQMDIRPPLSSMLYGAILGGFLGSLVASLNKADPTIGQTILRCFTSILMSVIAAVSLSRRGNTQAFVTVEDFYGAFFVGSLIGYGGVAFFERAILPQTTN